MQKYGKITDEGLLISNHMLEEYKPIKYGDVPSHFYEETHYLVEKEPIEFDDYIQIDYEAKELEIEVDEESELTLEEIKAGIEKRKKEYFERKEKPGDLEVLRKTVDSIFTDVLPMFFE